MEEKKKTKTLKQKKQQKKQFLFIVLFGIGVILFIGAAVMLMSKDKNDGSENGSNLKKGTLQDQYEWPDFQVDLLSMNPYTRSGKELKRVKGIVVHYTANPKTSAKQNRDYFEGLASSHKTTASCHFIIGLNGEALQLIPLNEISYASNNRNADTISIENCHSDSTGKFNKKTYQKLVEMCAWLCLRYSLTSDDIIRHYDVTGKLCPKYYVEHEDKWEAFKKDVSKRMKTYPKKKQEQEEK